METKWKKKQHKIHQKQRLKQCVHVNYLCFDCMCMVLFSLSLFSSSNEANSSNVMESSDLLYIDEIFCSFKIPNSVEFSIFLHQYSHQLHHRRKVKMWQIFLLKMMHSLWISINLITIEVIFSRFFSCTAYIGHRWTCLKQFMIHGKRKNLHSLYRGECTTETSRIYYI